jgi:hypothetical protein
VTAVDPATAARWRLRHLLLTGSTEPDPVAVLRRLAVVQGQDWLPAQWSLAQRSARPVTEPELLAAFDRGEILRTHVLRPTWHLLTPESIRVALTATADRVHRLNGHQYRLTGIDDEVARRARRVLEEVLPGRSLTRAELAEELARADIEAAGVRLAHIIMWAELDQVVCSGPVRGRQHTYALLDERAAPDPGLTVEEARARLARVYFATRGPATVRDLARWASLTITQARQAAAECDLEEVEVDGRALLVTRGDEPPPPTGGTEVHLIQTLDEIAMSYSDSRDLTTQGRDWTTGPPTGFFHGILVDGRLAGHWRYTRDSAGRPDRVETWAYEPFPPAVRDGIAAEVERFGGYVGRTLTWA